MWRNIYCDHGIRRYSYSGSSNMLNVTTCNCFMISWCSQTHRYLMAYHLNIIFLIIILISETLKYGSLSITILTKRLVKAIKQENMHFKGDLYCNYINLLNMIHFPFIYCTFSLCKHNSFRKAVIFRGNKSTVIWILFTTMISLYTLLS
jgi:hypothetical protein